MTIQLCFFVFIVIGCSALKGQRDQSRALGIGLERLDYTKGIPERLRGFDHLLD